MIKVLRTGVLATVQDLGRPGYAHLGVPRSGAAPARLGDRPVPTGRWLYARAGDVLDLGVPGQGLRTYLAVAGGITVPPTLGSRSSDTLSGLGPAPLRAGQELEIGPAHGAPSHFPDFVVPPVPGASTTVLRYRRGPRDDWFAEHALARFDRARWEVTARSDRVGVRLDGPEIATCRTDQLPSEGMMLGSIEIPPSGRPIVFLADHPTTGGYPVIGVVEAADVAVLAQARPGTFVRFLASAPVRRPWEVNT